jgi:hypothetical protein
MINIFCAKCGSGLDPSKMIRASDQYQINIEPCSCQNTLVDLAEMEFNLGEDCFVLSESEIDNICME